MLAMFQIRNDRKAAAAAAAAAAEGKIMIKLKNLLEISTKPWKERKRCIYGDIITMTT